MANQCWNCKHWEGPKAECKEIIETATHADPLDPRYGWLPDGECAEAHSHGTEIEIHGDAWATLTFNGNFGCIMWEEDNG